MKTAIVLKEIIIGIESYFKAHHFIQKNKLWKWILIPGILYALLFFIGMYYFSLTSSSFIEWMSVRTGLREWINKMDNGLLGFLFIFGGLLLWLMLMLLYFSLFKYLFLIIGSPLFAYLSEKTESIIEGREYPFHFSQFLKDIGRGFRIAIRNTLWQMVYTLSILFLSLIPVVGWLTPFLAITVECYYYGFSMLDYSMERHNKTTSQSIYFISHHKGLAIGNGVVFFCMHLLPIIGWILAPAYSVIAATLSLQHLKPTEAKLHIETIEHAKR